MIDMDDLIGDDDFFQAMTVWRRQIAFDANGQPYDLGSYINPQPYGSIQSGGNPDTARQSDMAVVGNYITVYTDFRFLMNGDRMNAGAPQLLAPATPDRFGNIPVASSQVEYRSDVVLFHGDPYEVIADQDWTDYGAGFVAVKAVKVSHGQVGL